MFTVDDAKKYCAKAIEHFNLICPNEDFKQLLSTLKYTIKLNKRLKVTAGCAYQRKDKVSGKRGFYMELNSTLLSRSTEEKQFQTVSHELAHILDYAIRHDSSHDKHWKQLHKWMGGTGNRCHSHVVDGLKNKVKRILIVNHKTQKEYVVSLRAYNKLRLNLALTNAETPGTYTSKLLTPEEVLRRKTVKSS